MNVDMCGRYTQGKAISEVVARYARLGVVLAGEEQRLFPGFNIAPTTNVAAVFRDEMGMRIGPFRWGFVPRWAKALDALKSTPFNARSETADTNVMFRDSFRSSRCLIPATGFYEWQGSKPPKQPFFIHAAGLDICSFAGLWSRWRAPDGTDLFTVAILTTEANETMKPIHNRMPCILHPENEEEWLARDTTADSCKALLRPFPAAEMIAYPVSTAVNRPGRNGPELVQPEDTINGNSDSLLC